MPIFNYQGEDKLKFLRHIQEPYLKEQVAEDPFSRYLGKNGETGSMILTKDSISKGKGTQVVFQMRYTGTADEIYDEETISGKGTLNKAVDTSMSVGEVTIVAGSRNFSLAEFETKFNFNTELNEQITEKRALLTKRRYINQFGFAFASGSKGNKDHISYDYITKAGQANSDFYTFFNKFEYFLFT